MINPVLIILLFLIGLVIMFDGVGSIYYYWSQPWFPDHTWRLIRTLIGLAIIIITLLINGG